MTEITELRAFFSADKKPRRSGASPLAGGPAFLDENLAPLRWGFCLGALPRCVQPTLRLGVEVVGLPTWKAGKPVWHNMTDLAPSPWRGFFWRPIPLRRMARSDLAATVGALLEGQGGARRRGGTLPHPHTVVPVGVPDGRKLR